MFILITGISGYIGSHIGALLIQHNYSVIGIDIVQPTHHFAHSFYLGSFGDKSLLEKIFSTHSITAIIHCGAFIEIERSVKDPAPFYENNVSKSLMLFKTALEHHVKQFIFASSCAVYGNPQYLPLDEQHPFNPINPYGRSKLAVEWMLQDFSAAYGVQTMALRFFNASGGWTHLGLGERHQPESHLIPRILDAAYHNRPVTIFGNAYNTIDGTCVRDYVSVGDIARAHLLTLKYFENGGTSTACNLGTAHGASILQVINEIQEQLSTVINYQFAPPRDGDAPSLVANPAYAKRILNWKATDSLQIIIKQALASTPFR